ncbi:MAG: hypothetical protein A2231_11110 [Candidatus Firestonebacteria bacterium RIFOXYA2_FULL_40_8]|nr:MAG: hypothetical protein A2231_11110 [Candidatus Firestonebacteria bacterium RIFOXYA2_FULL_40_8]
MKILFVQPPKTESSISSVDLAMGEPLAFEILAANLPEYDVRILDLRLEAPGALEKTISEFKPDVVGTTAFTVELYKARALLENVKKIDKNIITMIGGHHATLMPEDFDKDYIDIIVMGEGERIIKEVVDCIRTKTDMSGIDGIGVLVNSVRKYNKRKGLIMNIDELPFPNRKLTSHYRKDYFRGKWKPVTSVFSSRGCPYKCDFCAMWKVYDGKFRIRSAKRFVDELEMIPEKFININDDNTLQNIAYSSEICNEIRKRGIKKTYKIYGRSDTIAKHPELVEEWKSIGMELVLIGVEAFKDKDLIERNKKNTIKNNEDAIKILHKNGVEVIAYFLVDQNFTEEDFKQMAKYTQNLELTHPVFTILTPFPGTDLYEKTKGQLTTANFELFDVFHSVLPTKIPLKEFYLNFVELYRSAYSKKDNKFLSADMVNSLVGKFMAAHSMS